MSNSSLVNYTRISPNSNNPRKYRITKITIHHTASVATVEGLGRIFASAARQASSNYGIGSDGRVGLYVEECNRPWTSSDRDNDERAITIEVSNSQKGGNWPVSDKVLAKLIDLVTDICQRNGIEKLNYTGDKSGNLTRHNMFAATACPGPYLQSKFPYIAEEVNKRLAPKEDEGIYRITVADLSYDDAEDLKQYLTGKGLAYAEEKTGEKPAPTPVEPEKEWVPAVGDVVYFKGGLQYSQANGTTGAARPAGQAKITKIVEGKNHPYHLVKTGIVGPYGWVDFDDFMKE